MPNTDEGAPANPSGDDPNQVDPEGSPGDGTPGDPQGDQKTLEQRARQHMQGLVDQNQEFLKQGRYGEMDPKLVQMLTTYDQLTRPAAPNSAEPPKTDYGPGFGERSGSEGDPRTAELAEEGLKSKRRELVGQIAGQVEQDILKENWAEDIKALFAEYGKTGISDEDYESVDPLNRQKFPFNRQGYRAWLTAANAYRVRQIAAGAAATAEGEGEGDNASAVDKDRANAKGTKRRPQVKSAGQGAQDLATMAKRRREGRGPDDAEFRERIKQTIKRSVMGGSTAARQ